MAEPKQEPSGVTCSLCGASMRHTKLHGWEFWECPDCRAEMWPYDERKEREIRRAMYAPAARKKKRGGSRVKRRYKRKKPGEKWVPWYQR